MTPDAIYDGPAWARAKHMRRAEYSVAITLASKVLVGANPNRVGLIITPPTNSLLANNADSSAVTAADTSTTGIKLSKVSSGGTAEALVSATFVETAAVGVVADLELLRSAVTTKLGRFTTSGSFNGNLPLTLSDTIQWNVTTVQPASTSDFSIWLNRTAQISRVTLSVNSPAVDGVGLCLYAGQSPLVLWKDFIGDAFTEDIYCIGSSSGLQVGVWDIMY